MTLAEHLAQQFLRTKQEVTEANEAIGNDKLQKAQRRGLMDGLLETFKTWANKAGWDASAWRVTEQGGLLNPLGDEASFYEGAMSLQRIADMAALSPATVVPCFYVESSGEGPILPCQLDKRGQASVLIWATYDGETLHSAAGVSNIPAPPGPGLFVSLEGCNWEDGKWTDPVKLYTFMEYGFKLVRFKPLPAVTDDNPLQEAVVDDDDSNIPF